MIHPSVLRKFASLTKPMIDVVAYRLKTLESVVSKLSPSITEQGGCNPLTYLPDRRLDLVQALPDFELSSQRGVTDAQLSLTI